MFFPLITYILSGLDFLPEVFVVLSELKYGCFVQFLFHISSFSVGVFIFSYSKYTHLSYLLSFKGSLWIKHIMDPLDPGFSQAIGGSKGWGARDARPLSPISFIFTARKRSLQRLCFYMCLSFCPQGEGVWYPSMHHRSHDQTLYKQLPWGGFHKGDEQLICFLFLIFGRLSYS